jgi:zinc transport system substrate-binding protein
VPSLRGSCRAVLLAAVLGLAAGALTGCSDAPEPTPGPLAVLASFYPLEFVAERVGGDRVTVANLTPPGAEPHDLELAPQDVAAVSDADLVLTLSGFQPALDDAVTNTGTTALDVADAARLDLSTADGGGVDPHFWLDPTRLADVADAVAGQLGALDPEGATQYTANAEDLRADLDVLDQEFASGLATCDSRQLVTAHEAFGYLAQRYDLRQVGIAGVGPESEPTSADLARISDFVVDEGVTTVFYETLVSPEVARAVAEETGATTAVLDPLEGLVAATADDDYLTVMRDNLASLSTGLGCR